MPRDAKGNWYAPDQARADASVASAPRTATGNGAAFATADADSFEAVLAITAASGTTPTLTVSLETTTDGGTSWDTVSSFPQKTSTGTDGNVFGPLGDQCRWKWTIGGTTPSFTFSIATEANR